MPTSTSGPITTRPSDTEALGITVTALFYVEDWTPGRSGPNQRGLYLAILDSTHTTLLKGPWVFPISAATARGKWVEAQIGGVVPIGVSEASLDIRLYCPNGKVNWAGVLVQIATSVGSGPSGRRSSLDDLPHGPVRPGPSARRDAGAVEKGDVWIGVNDDETLGDVTCPASGRDPHPELLLRRSRRDSPSAPGVSRDGPRL